MVWRRLPSFRCRVPGPPELSLFALFQKPGSAISIQDCSTGIDSRLIDGTWFEVTGVSVPSHWRGPFLNHSSRTTITNASTSEKVVHICFPCLNT
jgi:hypothetical protein